MTMNIFLMDKKQNSLQNVYILVFIFEVNVFQMMSNVTIVGDSIKTFSKALKSGFWR